MIFFYLSVLSLFQDTTILDFTFIIPLLVFLVGFITYICVQIIYCLVVLSFNLKKRCQTIYCHPVFAFWIQHYVTEFHLFWLHSCSLSLLLYVPQLDYTKTFFSVLLLIDIWVDSFLFVWFFCCLSLLVKCLFRSQAHFFLIGLYILFFTAPPRHNPCCAACGILVPWPGIEPAPLHWKRRVLTSGLPGKSLSF